MANTSEYRNVISNVGSTATENSTEVISTESINTEAISEGVANLLTDTNVLKKINECCDELLMGNSPMQHSPVYGSELRSHLNCSCYSPLIVNVQVLTRHGNFPLKGVKVSIYENCGDMCPIAQPGYITDENGEIFTYISPQERCTVKNFTVEATYENVTEKLRKEIARLEVTDVGKESNPGRKVKAENIIPLVQDISGTKDDKDYYERVDFPDAEGKFPSGTEPKEEEVKAGTVPQKGFTDGSKVSTFTYDPFANCFDVTIFMATFSLQVPYLNQNERFDYVYAKTKGDANTQEFNVHRGPVTAIMEAKNHRDSTIVDSSPPLTPEEQKASISYKVWTLQGAYLCCPTSVAMLLNCIGIDISRVELIARCLSADSRDMKGKFDEISSNSSWQNTTAICAALKNIYEFDTYFFIRPETFNFDSLKQGLPVVHSIEGGHIVLVIGGVFNRNGKIIRHIVNDPVGTLFGTASVNVSGNWFKNGMRNIHNAYDTKGKHQYYRKFYVYARKNQFNFKVGSNLVVQKRTPFSTSQIAKRLTGGE